jgi:hypothetical protein
MMPRSHFAISNDPSKGLFVGRKVNMNVVSKSLNTNQRLGRNPELPAGNAAKQKFSLQGNKASSKNPPMTWPETKTNA